MRQQLQRLIAEAVSSLVETGELAIASLPEVQLDVPRNPQHGDFSTNVAMVLAKPSRMPPRQLAERILSAMDEPDFIANIRIEDPGFINFTLDAHAFTGVIGEILEQGSAYGRSEIGAGKRVQVEFVSANPTGPLHIGHGRGAAYGAVIADLLDAVGYRVSREYYVNDAGRQMDILALSVWLRYLENRGQELDFPANAYQGDYVRDLGSALNQEVGDRFETVVGNAPSNADPEELLDEWIAQCKSALGAESYGALHAYGRDSVLSWIRRDLSDFGISYDQWYSELSLARSGCIEHALEDLREADCIYEKDGAQWFRATDFGDEKDRVVVRENGSATYFASDIAYHADKYERGFDRVIDVWGADHHGYVPRIKAAMRALGKDPDSLEVLLVQFASLFRAGEKVQMSTRAGEFVTLGQLVADVGRDAARFFYVTRRPDQHLDFDLDLAKSQSSDNPVYYIQYAHARICSVFRQLEQKGLGFSSDRGVRVLNRLTENRERTLTSMLSRYPDVIEEAAAQREPHQLVNYLRELANEFHVYYNTHKMIVDDTDLRDARLALAAAARTVIGNGLALLGVSAPVEM